MVPYLPYLLDRWFCVTGLQRMALERFDALLANTPSPLPSHHFSVRPGGGGGGYGGSGGGYSGVSGSGGLSGSGFNPTAFPTGQKGDRRGAMKITNFDPSQDYNSLARQHSAGRLFEVNTQNSVPYCIFSKILTSCKSDTVIMTLRTIIWGLVRVNETVYNFRPVFKPILELVRYPIFRAFLAVLYGTLQYLPYLFSVRGV
jgi:hypothetical protein